MYLFRKLAIFTTFLHFSTTKATIMHRCHPSRLIQQLPVQNSCKKTVTNLLNSNSEYRDVELCTYMGSVCVSTAHDHFANIEGSDLCGGLLMKFAVRKLKTCKSFVEVISQTSLGRNSRNFEKVKTKKMTTSRRNCNMRRVFNPKYLKFGLCRF